ncbi:hypothetical protein LIER_14189 [Lithospermum erythrorhizon]|uniref:RNase H type-1 domain-containing protein n=1 Tax=Lithospermum erythrorhizon TaxID=34254 RepID=A0AAV3PY69_LITER
MTKIINNRLGLLLPRLISDYRAGFVHGRLIQDNILLAQEMLHHIDKGRKEGNVILNLDMSKAFDKLSWTFLRNILKKFGFSEASITIVMQCVDNSWFSLLINGESSGYFKSEQGGFIQAHGFVDKEERTCVLSAKASPARNYSATINLNCLANLLPDKGRLKLNIDAIFNNKNSGYGAIIRDRNGTSVWALGEKGWNQTALEAEIDATMAALKWITCLGYKKLIVEVHSLTIVMFGICSQGEKHYNRLGGQEYTIERASIHLGWHYS